MLKRGSDRLDLFRAAIGWLRTPRFDDAARDILLPHAQRRDERRDGRIHVRVREHRFECQPVALRRRRGDHAHTAVVRLRREWWR